MPRILAIDATEQQCSVALTLGDSVSVSRSEFQPRKHSELLLPMVDAILKESQMPGSELDAVAVTVGPGAFTGVRIGCSVAQGLAFGWRLPMVPILSLEALVHSMIKTSPASLFLGLLDARLGEVYAALYESTDSILSPVIEPCLVSPKQLNAFLLSKVCNFDRPLLALGSGLVHEKTVFQSIDGASISHYPSQQVSAVDVAQLALKKFNNGETIDCLALEPNYLRKAV